MINIWDTADAVLPNVVVCVYALMFAGTTLLWCIYFVYVVIFLTDLLQTLPLNASLLN